MQGGRQRVRATARAWLWAGLGLAGLAGPALAARVASVSPVGEVAEVRQVAVRFDEAVVPAGDPRRPAPFTLSCRGATPPGDGRWTSDRTWVYDLAPGAGRRHTLHTAGRHVLPAAGRCARRRHRIQLFHRRAGGGVGAALPGRAHRGRPAFPAAPERRTPMPPACSGQPGARSKAWASVCRCAWSKARCASRCCASALRDADPRHVLLLACQRPFPGRGRRAPGVGPGRVRDGAAATRVAPRAAFRMEGAAALPGRVQLRARKRAVALPAAAAAGAAFQRTGAAHRGAGRAAAPGAGRRPRAAHREPQRVDRRSALCRATARERALPAGAAAPGAGRDRPPAGQCGELSAGRGHGRAAAAGQVCRRVLRHRRGGAGGHAAADAAPCAGRPGRRDHRRPGGDPAARTRTAATRSCCAGSRACARTTPSR